jgi:hypothetical protein
MIERTNERKGGMTMGKFLLTVAVLAGAYIVVTSLPDVARYLKIREM